MFVLTTVVSTVPNRVSGFDLARGLAVFGMFFMNFKIVMQVPGITITGFWANLALVCEGRFGVLFIILAGIGVSLMTRRARMNNDGLLLKKNQKTLMLRALFLFIAGILFVPIWEADILHYYGIYIFAALFVVTWSNQSLLKLIAIVTAVFIPLFLIFNWEYGWDWDTLSYLNFWTAEGFMRHSFFNGFHPVFPWFAFFIFGMLMGRYDLSDKDFRNKSFVTATLVVVCCEFISYAIGNKALTLSPGLFFNTLSFPPFPLFILSGCASALMVIIACIIISEKVPGIILKPFITTGQMVLTHYVAHVVIGMMILEAAGKLYNQPLSFALKVSIVYFCLSVLFSVLWSQKFNKGPLETIMRKISG